MEIQVTGTARLQLLGSRDIIELTPAEIQFEELSRDEREMGEEITYAAVWQHESGAQVTWTLTEYPVGAGNFANTHVEGVKLLRDFDYRLVHTPDD